MIRLKAPAGMTSCSHAGRKYEVDKDGFVEVDSDAVAELTAHGLKAELPGTEEVKAIASEGELPDSKSGGKPHLKK